METEAIKLGIIERLQKIQDTSTLKKIEDLVTQSELESRTEESMKAISEGDVKSIDQMRKKNNQWRKEHMK